MRLLAAMYPQQQLEPEVARDRLAAYWIALSDLEDDQFVQAVQICVQRCRFFPVPAEIRESYDQLAHPFQGWIDAIEARKGLKPGTVIVLPPGDPEVH